MNPLLALYDVSIAWLSPGRVSVITGGLLVNAVIKMLTAFVSDTWKDSFVSPFFDMCSF
jgi:hypothetical protein